MYPIYIRSSLAPLLPIFTLILSLCLIPGSWHTASSWLSLLWSTCPYPYYTSGLTISTARILLTMSNHHTLVHKLSPSYLPLLHDISLLSIMVRVRVIYQANTPLHCRTLPFPSAPTSSMPSLSAP